MIEALDIQILPSVTALSVGIASCVSVFAAARASEEQPGLELLGRIARWLAPGVGETRMSRSATSARALDR